MLSPISITENLSRHFNLLPGIAMFSTRSIDDKLIKVIGSNPEIEPILNSNPENTSDPKESYRKLVLALKNEFFKDDILKIISIYFGGDVWKGWSESEKEQLFDRTMQEQNETGKQLERSNKLKEENQKLIPELHNALYNLIGYRDDFGVSKKIEQQIIELIHSSKIEIVTGVTNKDPGNWRIYIADACFEISAVKMERPKDFDIMYFTKFGQHLPPILTTQKKIWSIFLQELRNRAEMIDPSESTEMIEIEIIIAELAANYKITQNPEEWIKATGMLFEFKDCYLITPKKMKELTETLNTKTDLGKLSDIMSQRGMKKSGNPTISVVGIKTRAWWFKKDFLDSYRNAKLEDDANE